MKWLILIILLVLVIILILNFKEGFKSDYSDYTNIDRINVDNKYAYCIGALPRCETGAPIKIGVYNGGTTYRSICDDGSNMVCNNSLSVDISNNYIWKTPNNRSIMFSNIYKGFTNPTSYIPAIINENVINFYDGNNNIIDSIDKCSILGINTNNCKKALKIPFQNADISNNDVNAFNNQIGYNTDPQVIGNFISSYTEIAPISEGTSGMYSNLPCIADHGANIGDNVCNGEVGLIQDKTLVCPYYKPICSGYRCGSTFGTCSYSK
jgi:hypothetical protein